MLCPYFSMNFIAIDPGVNTGIVVCDYYSDKPIVQITSRWNVITDIREILSKFDISRMDAIVESAPAYGDKHQIERVERVVSVLKEYLTDDYIHMISPGHWKNLAKARGWAREITGTIHEKDAYCMLMYYRMTTSK